MNCPAWLQPFPSELEKIIYTYQFASEGRYCEETMLKVNKENISMEVEGEDAVIFVSMSGVTNSYKKSDAKALMRAMKVGTGRLLKGVIDIASNQAEEAFNEAIMRFKEMVREKKLQDISEEMMKMIRVNVSPGKDNMTQIEIIAENQQFVAKNILAKKLAWKVRKFLTAWAICYERMIREKVEQIDAAQEAKEAMDAHKAFDASNNST
jgi:hypothetical protein